MSVGQALVTAEEFQQIAHEHDGLVELVRGEVIEKINEYFHPGVPEVWMLDPQKIEPQIHLPSNGSPGTLRDGDTLTSDRLPGFECPVSDLFEGC